MVVGLLSTEGESGTSFVIFKATKAGMQVHQPCCASFQFLSPSPVPSSLTPLSLSLTLTVTLELSLFTFLILTTLAHVCAAL